ncbi:hypothetical protein ABZX51_009123 [Aspergillus tubingensis]
MRFPLETLRVGASVRISLFVERIEGERTSAGSFCRRSESGCPADSRPWVAATADFKVVFLDPGHDLHFKESFLQVLNVRKIFIRVKGCFHWILLVICGRVELPEAGPSKKYNLPYYLSIS